MSQFTNNLRVTGNSIRTAIGHNSSLINDRVRQSKAHSHPVRQFEIKPSPGSGEKPPRITATK
jgi:hypothetical protein